MPFGIVACTFPTIFFEIAVYEKEINMIRITASLFFPFQSYCHSGWLLIARFSNCRECRRAVLHDITVLK